MLSYGMLESLPQAVLDQGLRVGGLHGRVKPLLEGPCTSLDDLTGTADCIGEEGVEVLLDVLLDKRPFGQPLACSLLEELVGLGHEVNACVGTVGHLGGKLVGCHEKTGRKVHSLTEPIEEPAHGRLFGDTSISGADFTCLLLYEGVVGLENVGAELERLYSHVPAFLESLGHAPPGIDALVPCLAVADMQETSVEPSPPHDEIVQGLEDTGLYEVGSEVHRVGRNPGQDAVNPILREHPDELLPTRVADNPEHLGPLERVVRDGHPAHQADNAVRVHSVDGGQNALHGLRQLALYLVSVQSAGSSGGDTVEVRGEGGVIPESRLGLSIDDGLSSGCIEGRLIQPLEDTPKDIGPLGNGVSGHDDLASQTLRELRRLGELVEHPALLDIGVEDVPCLLGCLLQGFRVELHPLASEDVELRLVPEFEKAGDAPVLKEDIVVILGVGYVVGRSELVRGAAVGDALCVKTLSPGEGGVLVKDRKGFLPIKVRKGFLPIKDRLRSC